MTAPMMDMGQMLGILVNLSELEERKKARLQDASQHDERMKQMAKQLGIEETDKRFSQVTRMLSTMAESATKTRGALSDLAGTFGWSPEQVSAISQYALQAPETVTQLRNQAAQQGYADASPQQRGQMNREAAFGATSGMSQGGAAQSGLQAMLNVNGDPAAMDQIWSQGLQQSLQTGNAVRQADPFGGAMQVAGLNTPGMAQQAAGIQFGGNLTAAQQGNLQLGGEQLSLDRIRLALQEAEQTARLKLASGADMPTVVQIMSEMRQTAGQAANGDVSREVRDEAWKRYNSLARLLGGAGPAAQAPAMPNLIEQYMAKYRMEGPLPNSPQHGTVPSPFTPRLP